MGKAMRNLLWRKSGGMVRPVESICSVADVIKFLLGVWMVLQCCRSLLLNRVCADTRMNGTWQEMRILRGEGSPLSVWMGWT
ncbi:unnamed protein product [Ilex paraguariensis]|uniref:Uncharacterized protein n=1 Tax=Ilex paraguariensis TaxID=185542 RepID=A0ABC8USV9_9AQUA